MSNKKRDVIFEVPKEELPHSVQVLMDMAEKQAESEEETCDTLDAPLVIDFAVQNSKVRYSLHGNLSNGRASARMIVKAVQSYGVVSEKAVEKTRSSSSVGEKTVNYNRCVRIDWRAQKIFTSFDPTEGDVFLKAMAIVVEELQKTTPEPTS